MKRIGVIFLAGVLLGCDRETQSLGIDATPIDEERPGKLRVTVVYASEELSGSQPDIGAKILLVPAGARPSKPFGAVGPASNQAPPDGLTDARAYFREVGLDGKAFFDSVRPGIYRCFIISKNTWEGQALRPSNLLKLEGLIRDAEEQANRKSIEKRVEVFTTKTGELFHDFGPSYDMAGMMLLGR